MSVETGPVGLLESLDIKYHTHTIALSRYQSEFQDVTRFLDCCKACHNYGQQWVCPPLGFDPIRHLLPYSMVHLYGFQVMMPTILREKRYSAAEKYDLAYQLARIIRKRVDPLLLTKEKEHPGSEAFFPGKCHLCPDGQCTRLATPPRPCRHKAYARHSLEQLGFDLSRSASELLGVPMLWGTADTVPAYYLYIGALLTP